VQERLQKRRKEVTEEVVIEKGRRSRRFESLLI